MRIGEVEIDDRLMDQACKEYGIEKFSIVVDEEIIKELNDDVTKTFFETKKIPLIAIDKSGNIYKYIKLNVLRGAKVPLLIKVYFKEEKI